MIKCGLAYKILFLFFFFRIDTVIAVSLQQGFAIVVDSTTYRILKSEITLYAQAIREKNKLETYVVIDRWGVPDSIRMQLYQLYTQKNKPIEGAVFIGDIPIPMIRDAQHFTSAFKMNQTEFDRKESSVPSDRYYDDFDLDFRFLGRDQERSNYFYYSLTAASAQRLHPDLYTGRIQANNLNGTTCYQKIAFFLKKAVASKQESNVLDQILYFSGSGYVSESMQARIDEKIALLDNFPWLNQQQNGIEYINHARDKSVKYRLMNEMKRTDLDLALLHHHGDSAVEYLNNYPLSDSPADQKSYIQLYLRECVRYAAAKGENTDSVTRVLSNRFDGIPDKWFQGVFDTAVAKKDSLFFRSLDLYFEDFEHYRPQVEMVILDACFNGAFQKEKNISSAYLFEGQTIAVMANTVNVIQDKWHDRYVGLMAMGMCAGRMVQLHPYLESHLLGDPTFFFTPLANTFNVNEALVDGGERFWRKKLRNPYTAVRTLAMRQLVYEGKKNYSSLLLDIFRNSTSYVERMEALELLAIYNDENFITCLQLAVNDSYELIQRFALKYISKKGDTRLVPALIRVAIRNNTSERIEFNTKMALGVYPEAELMKEFEKQFFQSRLYTNEVEVYHAIKNSIKANAGKWEKEIGELFYKKEMKEKQQIFKIRMLRNYNFHSLVPQLLEYLQQMPEPDLQVQLLEALGWFHLSYRNLEIAKIALQMSQNSVFSPQVREEALKTYKRLIDDVKIGKLNK